MANVIHLVAVLLLIVANCQLEGLYKGIYDEGTSLLILKHLNIINNNLNKINANVNNSVIYASKTNARLMFLNGDYKRFTHPFWFGIYDKSNSAFWLSNSNFSYDVKHKNTSFRFVEKNNKTSSASIKLCLEILYINTTNLSNNMGFGDLKTCKSGNKSIVLHDLSFTLLEVFEHKANSYGIVSLAIVSVSFYFLFKQYEYSNAMGRAIKISFLTLYSQFIYNGIVCFLHFDAAMNVDLLFTTFLIITFVCIMNANLYQRMMRNIWAITYTLNANNEKLLNFLKIFSFLIIVFVSQYCLIGTYNYLIYFLFLSDWTFQIIHNIKTGYIQSWKLSVTISNTIAKLFFPLYLYGCPKNIIENPTNYLYCVILIFWSSLQLSILYSMDYKLNSRWFIPETMKPIRYKYHKTPNYDIDAIDDENVEENKSCAICLEIIFWKKEYKDIMVTPCYHYFHDNCLKTWMQQRYTCPTCRSDLPPFF